MAWRAIVNFARGTWEAKYSPDVAAGAEMYHKEQRSAAFQIQAENLTAHVNVINFASLFSGTAVAPPRSVSARLKLTFYRTRRGKPRRYRP